MTPEELDEQLPVPEEPEEQAEQIEEMPQPSAEEIEQLRQKANDHDALLDRLKRVTADYENSLKRLDRASEERIKYAVETLAREVLPGIDNLARAIESAAQKHSLEALIEGVELVERQLYGALARHGIAPIETKPGEPFNPDIHDAVGVVHSDKHPVNAVAEERQRGFRFHGRLLRPAQVLVSAGPQPPVQPKPEA